VRYCQSRGLKAKDIMDIVTQVFNMKLESFLKDLKENRIFGKTMAYTYFVLYFIKIYELIN